MACSLIADRKVSTAILVNRAELIAQWRERINQYLDIDSEFNRLAEERVRQVIRTGQRLPLPFMTLWIPRSLCWNVCTAGGCER